MRTVTVSDVNGVIHHYNPRYIKDVQEIENNLNGEWCLNIILDGEGEHINPILFKTKGEMEAKRDLILACMESV